MAYSCDAGCGNPAATVITDLNDGNVTAYCLAHSPVGPGSAPPGEYPCSMCVDDPAAGVMLVTNLAESDRLALCAAHVPMWAAATAEAFGWEPLAPPAAPEANGDGGHEGTGAADAAPNPRRRRRVAVHVEDDRPAVGAETETPPAEA